MEVKETSNPVPSVEEIKELCDFIKFPLNNQVMLINPVAPMVTYSGTIIPENDSKEMQKAINDKGLVVASPCKVTDENGKDFELNIGDKIVLAINTQPTLQKVITSDKLVEGLDEKLIEQYKNNTGRFENMLTKHRSAYFRKFVILFVHPMNIVALLK